MINDIEHILSKVSAVVCGAVAVAVGAVVWRREGCVCAPAVGLANAWPEQVIVIPFDKQNFWINLVFHNYI